MYTSQFQFYSASDSGAPIMSGSSGSLVNLLDKCLVNGYGTKLPAGWTKFYSGSGANTFSATYRQGTGSLNYLYVVDSALGIGTSREARIVGYTMIDGPSGSAPAGTGSGYYAFPTGSQAVGTAPAYPYIMARKSADVTTVRNWKLLADSSSMYCFIQTGDVTNTYFTFMFGDLYMPSNTSPSVIYNTSPINNCLIVGRITEGNAAAATDRLDVLGVSLATVVTGHFMPSNLGGGNTAVGGGSSITVGKHGDAGRGSSTVLVGTVAYPNSVDNAVYLSPVWVHDNVNLYVRGSLRGFWQLLHVRNNFTDGQNITGSGDLAGRTFHLIVSSSNAGLYCMETSNTVETS